MAAVGSGGGWGYSTDCGDTSHTRTWSAIGSSRQLHRAWQYPSESSFVPAVFVFPVATGCLLDCSSMDYQPEPGCSDGPGGCDCGLARRKATCPRADGRLCGLCAR